MYFALVVLAIVVCVLLGLFILIQNPKGGGLASGFSGSNVMGVQRTGDFLEKGTWVLAITLIVLSLLVNITIPKGGAVNEDANDIQNQITKPAATNPLAPTPAPQQPADT
ncbi:MAG TPA: preprotein translocase subunit SecG, partial [Sphingobacteriaceae bacterium]